MITLDEEAYNRGFREGKAEGLSEGLAEGMAEAAKQVPISTIVYLVKDRGMTIEEASTYVLIPDDLKSEIMDTARRLLE